MTETFPRPLGMRNRRGTAPERGPSRFHDLPGSHSLAARNRRRPIACSCRTRFHRSPCSVRSRFYQEARNIRRRPYPKPCRILAKARTTKKGARPTPDAFCFSPNGVCRTVPIDHPPSSRQPTTHTALRRGPQAPAPYSSTASISSSAASSSPSAPSSAQSPSRYFSSISSSA